jgi:CheY-like chemotaxis protein
METDFGSWADTGAGERTIRVLHVEDDPSFTDLTATFLQRESESFEIVSAHSAAEGLKRLAALDVDCIVSDYQMPGQNGLETT